MAKLAPQADLCYNNSRNIVVLGGAVNTPSRIHLIGDVPMDTVPHRDLNNKSNQHYVYTLAYPESMGGRIFYVGKGIRSRLDGHEREARNGGTSYKCAVIHEIWANGEQIVKTKIAYFATDREARMYEAALIFFMDGLTNLSWDAPITSKGSRGGGQKRRPVVFIDQEAKRQKRFLNNQRQSELHKGRKRSEESLRKQHESIKRHHEERQRRMESKEYQALKQKVEQERKQKQTMEIFKTQGIHQLYFEYS